jgi:N-ethylmaleimide reductase
MLDEIGIAYLHIAEADWDDAPEMPMAFGEALQLVYSGATLYTGQYDRERAEAAVAAGWADFIGFGRPFIANPDLPRRLASDAVCNSGNQAGYFGGRAEGYIDYPTVDEGRSSMSS